MNFWSNASHINQRNHVSVLPATDGCTLFNQLSFCDISLNSHCWKKHFKILLGFHWKVANYAIKLIVLRIVSSLLKMLAQIHYSLGVILICLSLDSNELNLHKIIQDTRKKAVINDVYTAFNFHGNQWIHRYNKFRIQFPINRTDRFPIFKFRRMLVF